MKIRTLEELLALQPLERAFVIEPAILSVAGNLFVYGHAETFKSWIVLDMAYCIATGTPWLGFRTQRSKVLIVQVEQPELMYRRRVLKYIEGVNGTRPQDVGQWLHFCNEADLKMDNFFTLGQLEAEVQTQKYKVIVFDNLYRTLSGSTKDEILVQKWLDNLSVLSQKYGVAFIIVHHKRKGSTEEGTREQAGEFEEMTGTARFGYWADTIIRTVRDNQYEDTLTLTFEKQRNAEETLTGMRCRFVRSTARFSVF